MDYFLLYNTYLVFYRPVTTRLSNSTPCIGRVCRMVGSLELLILLEYLPILSCNEINAVVWNQGILYRDAFND